MQQKEGKMTLMLPPGVVYGVASSSSWSKSICNLDICITRIRRSLEDYCLLSKVNTLKGHGQAGLHLSPPKRASSLVPTWLDGNIRWVGCTRNQVLGRSPIRALIRVKALGLSHSWQITYIVSQYWIICEISSITGVDHRTIVVESLAFGLRTMRLVDCKEEVLK